MGLLCNCREKSMTGLSATLCRHIWEPV